MIGGIAGAATLEQVARDGPAAALSAQVTTMCGDAAIVLGDGRLARVDGGTWQWDRAVLGQVVGLSCSPGGRRIAVFRLTEVTPWDELATEVALVDAADGADLAPPRIVRSWRWSGDDLVVVTAGTDGPHALRTLPDGPVVELGRVRARYDGDTMAVVDETAQRYVAPSGGPGCVVSAGGYRDVGPVVAELWTDRTDPASAIPLAPCEDRRPGPPVFVPGHVFASGCIWRTDGTLVRADAWANSGLVLADARIFDPIGRRSAPVDQRPRVLAADDRGFVLGGPSRIELWDRDCLCRRWSARSLGQVVHLGAQVVWAEQRVPGRAGAMLAVWDRATGRLLAELPHLRRLTELDDGRLLAGAPFGIPLQPDVDAATVDPARSIGCMAAAPDGVAVTGWDRWWSVGPSGRAGPPEKLLWEGLCVVPQAGGGRAAVQLDGSGRAIRWWDADGKLRAHVDVVDREAYRLTAAGLLRADARGVVLKRAGVPIRRWKVAGEPDLSQAAVSDDGQVLAVEVTVRGEGSDAHRVVVCTGRASRVVAEGSIFGAALTLSPDGRQLLILDQGEELWRVDLTTGEPPARVAVELPEWPAGVAASDRHAVVLRATDAAVIDLSSGEVVQELAFGPLERPTGAVWSADGRTLWISTSRDAVTTWRWSG